MDVDGQVAQEVRVAAVFVVVPAEDLGVGHGELHATFGESGDRQLEARDPRQVELDEAGARVRLATLDDDGGTMWLKDPDGDGIQGIVRAYVTSGL